MIRRTVTALPAAMLSLALLAPAALADNTDSGQGILGEADDKVVTYFGFGVIAFFVIFVSVMSALQWKLDQRKQARWAAKKARASRYRGGW